MTKLILMTSLLAGACIANDEPELETQATQAIGTCACPAGTPAAIAPAADQDLAFALDASGLQKYTCGTTGTWGPATPDAALYNHGKVAGHHYAGPTWEWRDGSTVRGARAAGATVDPTAIPWLLLTAVGHNDVDGKMTDITSIQRVSTSGGLAPAGACTPGATADVPYTAVYLFYRTKADHPENNTRCGA